MVRAESPGAAVTAIGMIFVTVPAVSFRLVEPGLMPVIDTVPILASFFGLSMMSCYWAMVAMVLSRMTAVNSYGA